MAAGLIAEGVVDERDIRDVSPDELYGYPQCHFFAGIGVWSYALRQAGWSDDRRVWTGSCPCQPFSASGRRGGFDDERHLWPAWHHLIRVCKPECVFGEQVASKNGLAWFDLVSSDLEGEGYAVGAADTCAAGFSMEGTTQDDIGIRLLGIIQDDLGETAGDMFWEWWLESKFGDGYGFGAPHIRQRLYFVADTELSDRGAEHESDGIAYRREGLGRNGATGELGHSELGGRQGCIAGMGEGGSETCGERRPQTDGFAGSGIAGRAVGDPECERVSDEGYRPTAGTPSGVQGADGERERIRTDAGQSGGLTNGFWRSAQWLWCRDGKYRPIGTVEPGAQPLADGLAAELGLVCAGDHYQISPLIQKGKNRVGRLRGYGNSLVAPQAQAFVEAYMDITRGSL
jgi:DNA (cytosine-5)-methyltransferase 1